MIGLKIIGRKDILCSSLAALATCIAFSIAVGTSIEVVESLRSAVLGSEVKVPLVIQSSARSVYTSIIPARIAYDLREVAGIEAEPIIASLAYVDGRLASVWSTSRYFAEHTRNWAVLGSKLAGLLAKEVGDLVVVSSLLRPSLHVLKITKVESFGDERDWYLFTSASIARDLRGISSSSASAVLLRNPLDEARVAELIGGTYRLTIKYDVPVEVRLRVVASDGSTAATLRISEKGSRDVKLGFGAYSLIASTGFAELLVGRISLTRDEVIKLRIGEEAYLEVAGIYGKPILLGPDGKEIEPNLVGGLWVFKVKPGIYLLKTEEGELEIPLMGRTRIDRLSRPVGTIPVMLDVRWINGERVEDAYIVIVGEGGDVIAATRLGEEPLRLELLRGSYKVRLAIMGLLVERSFSVVRESDITITIPMRATRAPTYIPPASLKVLGSGQEVAPSVGLLAASSEAAVALASAILGLVTLYSVYLHVLYSAKARIAELIQLRFSGLKLAKIIAIPFVAISLTVSLAAGLAAIYLADIAMQGYVFPIREERQTVYLIYPLTVSLIASVLAYLNAVRRAKEWIGWGRG